MRHNPAKVVNRSVFSQLFGKAWSQAMTIGNVTASFTITGIHPFNWHAISLPGKDTQDTVGSSRQFLPLISTPPCKTDESLAGICACLDGSLGRLTFMVVVPCHSRDQFMLVQ